MYTGLLDSLPTLSSFNGLNMFMKIMPQFINDDKI